MGRDGPSTVHRYLERLGVARRAPTAAALAELHRAHVAKIPYETTWIAMGEPWTVDVEASVQRIAWNGRGGYCYHLNGAFSWLLEQLGYAVTRHVGGVHGPDGPTPQAMANHLALTVSGLPSPEHGAGTWYADVGLGDALFEPLPLADGTYRQGPMTFRLTRLAAGPGDWWLHHDMLGSFPGMVFSAQPATMAEFADRHVQLATAADSHFRRTLTAQVRDVLGVSIIRALTVTRREGAAVVEWVVTDRREWFATLADLFHLDLGGTTAAQRQLLWDTATLQHAARR